ncbi:MAG: hypothetical protein D6813_04760 [Calditrichaeota bacterium]|nr:MAG: hypothetical protein D6813_04760 [Calditrichota bacterium]
MMFLKGDFHLHTADDRHDYIQHTAEELIDHAARKGFKLLSITNHDTFTFHKDLYNYALDRGILLIPGIEKKIENKHVLLLNAFPACEKIKTFEELRRAKSDGLFVIAPHPFFKTLHCLEDQLIEHIELFDAIEYSFFYSKWFNFNKKAVAVACDYDLPLVGNSDCHLLKYFGLCHSLIYAEQLNELAVFEAIRAKKIKVISEPIFLPKLVVIFMDMVTHKYRVKYKIRKKSLLTVKRTEEDVYL